jgi:4-amino-4-deoxy-L-arabinose transferase-like glycosyltransferase
MQKIRAFLTPRRLLIAAVLTVLFVQTAFWLPAARTRGFASSDAGAKLWQVQSVIRTGRLDAPVDYPGEIYDPEHQYSPYVSPWFFWQDGKPYSEYTSPFIWASAPLYAALGHKGLLILPWLSGALLAVLTAWLMWRIRQDSWAALAPLIVGLSSPLLIYSIEFWEHAPGVALAAFALIGIVKAIDSRRHGLWLMASGAALGLGLTIRAELYVYPIAIVIGLLLLRSLLPLRRSLVWLAIGGLLIAGPWWVYQAVRWGNPLGPRISQNVPLLGGGAMLKRLGDTTGRNWTMLWPTTGSGLDWLMVLGVTALALTVIRLVVRNARINRWLIWAQVLAFIGMSGIIVWRLANWSTELGQRPDDLLMTFPVWLMLLITLPLSKASADRAASVLSDFLLGVAISFLALVILFSPFQGGIQWGPRFLLPVIVPLTVALIDRVARMWDQADRSLRLGLAAAFSVLVVAGGYSAWLGMQFMRNGQNGNAAFQQLISELPESVVVTDAWFLPQGAPYTFGDKIWLMAEDKKNMFQLLQRLRKQTDEPGMIYVSSLTWAHLDPQILMGARIAQNGDFQYFDWPGMYVQVARYFLYE